MLAALTLNTRKVAQKLSPTDKAIENRMFHHMLLAQKLLAAMRNDEREHKPHAMMTRNWINALPTTDLTNMIFWDKKALIEIDSPNIISQYKSTLSFNQRVYKLLIEDPESPYMKFASEFQGPELKLGISFE